MITEKQRQNRRKYLGSSDAPAVAGVSPWRNPADVYWDKIKSPSENESEPHNEAITVGNLCEGAVLDWFCRETGKKILRNQRRVHENGIMAASFDALVVGENEAVEAKTTGITSPLNRDEWGEVGTDEVPNYILAQVQHQMAVLPEIKIIWVPVLMGGVGFRMYRVERSDELIETLEKIEVKFWTEYVEKRLPPPDDLPTIETIKKIDRAPNKTVRIADDMISAWLNAKSARSAAEKVEEEAKRTLLAALGDAEAGECSFGKLTYFQQSMKERVLPATTYRVPRFKEFKKEAA